MQPDFKKRMHARNVLNHSWFSELKVKNNSNNAILPVTTSRQEPLLDRKINPKLLDNLRDFWKFTSLRRTTAIAVAFNLPASQTTEMRYLFQTFDTDFSGALSLEVCYNMIINEHIFLFIKLVFMCISRSLVQLFR